VQSSTGNCWRRPSECIWQTPITLRYKAALKEQYEDSNIDTISFLQTALEIKDASIEDYISDLDILRNRGNFDRNDVEILYKQIELQWKPETNTR
jgi:hypothetical protein